MGIKELLRGIVTQQELLNYYNANITEIKLPCYISGLVFNYRGINNIFINKNLSYYKKRKTILHELAHIELNQLCRIDKDLFEFHVQDFEDEVDRYINQIKNLPVQKK